MSHEEQGIDLDLNQPFFLTLPLLLASLVREEHNSIRQARWYFDRNPGFVLRRKEFSDKRDVNLGSHWAPDVDCET